MPSFDDARKIILQNITPLGSERVQLLNSLARIVTEDIPAPWDMPFCDISAMDGFAVRAEDCSAVPTSLRVSGYMPAGGSATYPVTAGGAVKIMTGAPIPPGSDAVVPVEETAEDSDRVLIRSQVAPGQHIRFRGADMPSGETLITAGTLVRPSEINMLAAMGYALVPVYRRARVAVISTGDELIELGQPPSIGKTIDSNALSLAASLKAIGADPVILGIARDDRQSHLERMEAGLLCDALITSAGVSAGDRDLVRDTLQELGVRQLFWKIDIKPGGPTAFGMKDHRPVFSLPGNPVSTMVTFEMFVKPALLKMMGHTRIIRQWPAPGRYPQDGRQTQFYPCSYRKGKWTATGLQRRKPAHRHADHDAQIRRPGRPPPRGDLHPRRKRG